MTTFEVVATAGSTAYVTKDAEQERMNMTPANTHVSLVEACKGQSYADDPDME